jgi:hypothetical protein
MAAACPHPAGNGVNLLGSARPCAAAKENAMITSSIDAHLQ